MNNINILFTFLIFMVKNFLFCSIIKVTNHPMSKFAISPFLPFRYSPKHMMFIQKFSKYIY